MIEITEQEITKNWSAETTPLVTICCTTYNHEKYISKAIDGFLIQNTNFPFEVIIRDDCSTDKTADIVRAYADRFPRIIRPIFERENTYSEGTKPMRSILRRVKTEYIAICEGDDHWLDRNKLQIQIDFLRNHQDYVMSGHDAFVINEKDEVTSESKLPNIFKKDISGEDLIMGHALILTLSMVFRNIFVKEGMPMEHTQVRNGDIFLVSILGRHGKSKYHSEVSPAAYRTHPGGLWSLVSRKEQAWHSSNTNFWLQKYYERIGEKEHANYFRRTHRRSIARQVGIFDLLVARYLKVKRKLIADFNRLTRK